MSKVPTKVPIRAKADCPTATRSEITCGKHTFTIDEPAERHGEDRGASPLEYLMAAYAGCTNVIANEIAKERELSLRIASIEVVGHLDRRGIMGEEKVANPFPSIRLTVNASTSASEEELKKLREDLAWRCPVSAVLRGAGAAIEEKWNVSSG